MNVSAVMMKLRFPYIAGYKPHDHYQRIPLEQAVVNEISKNNRFIQLVNSWVTDPIVRKRKFDWGKVLTERPELKPLENPVVSYHPLKDRDYLAEEQQNRKIGDAGEQFVLEYEKWMLRKSGLAKLSNMVVWASKEVGDGLGYDILSKFGSGEDKFIEVKATTQGKYTPFYFTENELNFSSKNSERYSIYRVFNLFNKPSLYISEGYIGSKFDIRPITYQANVGSATKLM
jgi:hypothetical protein